ncbi:MAG: VirB4 family type IV secretion system protein [Bryobacteraceae bacterium]|jgi:type IV secretory pathway VirB4 component
MLGPLEIYKRLRHGNVRRSNALSIHGEQKESALPSIRPKKVRAFRKSVPLQGFVDETAALTKEGHAVVCFSHQGVDDECQTDQQRGQDTDQLRVAQRQFDVERTYQYIIRRGDCPIVQQDGYPNPKVQEFQDERRKHLDEKARFGSIEIYTAIVRQGEYRGKTSTDEMIAERRKACSMLLSKAQSFTEETGDPFGTRLLSKHETFLFLRKLLNLNRSVADSLRLKRDYELDWQLVGQPLDWDNTLKHYRQGSRHVRVLSIKEAGLKSDCGLPNQSKPNLLKEMLTVDADMIICQQFEWKERAEVRDEVKSSKKHINDFERHGALDPELEDGKADELMADESAEDRMRRLGSIVRDMENEGDIYGYYSYTVILHGEDNEKLNRAIAQINRIWGEFDGALFEETRGAAAAYFSILPGNFRFNKRQQLLSNRHFADLSLCYAPDTGSLETSELEDGTEYLSVFETRDFAPFYWDPYVGGAFGLFGTGRRGHGKTFLANHIVSSAQKYNGRTVILDLGHNYRQTVQFYGGEIISLSLRDRKFKINPFAVENTPDNVQFVFQFLRFLIEESGGALEAEHEKILHAQTVSMWKYDIGERTLSEFHENAHPAYKERLSKWIQGGQYGWVFDNAEDTVSLSRLTCFEFAGSQDYPDLMEPLILWVLGRARMEFFDPSVVHEFKLINLDEVWKFLKSPRILDWLADMLKFGRNRLVATALWTQSAEDLGAAKRLVIDNCETIAFLGNPDFDRDLYANDFGFNERELELAGSLNKGKREFLLRTLQYSKVLRLTVDPKSYWRWTTRPKEQRQRQEAIRRYGDRAIEVLAASGAKL